MNQQTSDLVAKHYLAVSKSMAKRYASNAYLAEEAVQIAAVELITSEVVIEKPEAFVAYFYKLANFRAIGITQKERRANKHVVRSEFEIERAFAEEADLELSLPEEIRAFIRTLPLKQRTVVELRVYGAMSLADIARLLELNADTVKANFRHGIQKVLAHAESLGLREAA